MKKLKLAALLAAVIVGIGLYQFLQEIKKPQEAPHTCICQGKVDTKNTIALEAQFGLVLNWAFVAQSGRRSLVIIVMNILVQQFRNILGCR